MPVTIGRPVDKPKLWRTEFVFALTLRFAEKQIGATPRHHVQACSIDAREEGKLVLGHDDIGVELPTIRHALQEAATMATSEDFHPSAAPSVRE
jgi:hypothetical protein